MTTTQMATDGNSSYTLSPKERVVSVTNCSTCAFTDEYNFFEEYQKVHGYVAIVICLLGILGNFLNIVVLSRPKLAATPVNFLLMMISVFELLMLGSYLPLALYTYIIEYEPHKMVGFFRQYWSAVFHAVFVYLGVLFHTIAVWLTIIVATFRWLTLQLTNGKMYSNLKMAKLCTIIVVVFSILINIPNWCIVDIASIHRMNIYFVNTTLYYAGTRKGMHHFNSVYGVLAKIIPSILLLILTIPLITIMTMAKRHRQNLLKGGSGAKGSQKHADHRRTTGMLLTVVILFLCVELPHGIYILCMGADKNLERIYVEIAEIIDILTLLAFSINLIFYTVMSRLFRNTFMHLFCKNAWIRRSNGLHQLSTMFTSIRQSGTHKRSMSSNLSTVETIPLRGDRRTQSSKFLQPVSSPLLSDETRTTSMHSYQSG